MAIERVRIPHPGDGVGAALVRAFPVLDDAEARRERRLVHRIDLKRALK